MRRNGSCLASKMQKNDAPPSLLPFSETRVTPSFLLSLALLDFATHYDWLSRLYWLCWLTASDDKTGLKFLPRHRPPARGGCSVNRDVRAANGCLETQEAGAQYHSERLRRLVRVKACK